MPRILIVFYSHDGRTAAIADAVARGAEEIRFTEVELRRIGDSTARAGGGAEAAAGGRPAVLPHRALGPSEELAEFDGIVFGSPGIGGGQSAELESLFGKLEALASRGAFANTVASAFTSSVAADEREPTLWSVVRPMTRLGMLIVPPLVPVEATEPSGATGASPDALDGARALGRRVARVTGWVTHGLGHEHSHDGHGHEHHGHSHGGDRHHH